MFFKKMSNCVAMSLLAVIMFPAFSSFGDSFSKKWEVESIRLKFPENDADDVPDDEPAKTVWRLLESVVDEDKDQFADQYSESKQETIQQKFKKWQERLSHGYPTAMVLQGEREDGTAFVAMHSSIPGDAPNAKTPFYGIIFLRQNEDNMWKIIPSIENDQEVEYLEELFLKEVEKKRQKVISKHRKKIEKKWRKG